MPMGALWHDVRPLRGDRGFMAPSPNRVWLSLIVVASVCVSHELIEIRTLVNRDGH